ncbi:hypothetical protein MSG28_002844 [Choristoneura fumiferana]|uniref:Uncharacterized protein n=1 Tax=Choristoneura fumiferana TaxID=7141 RepID=A0ACC0JJK9_CHOFU|nr:hypothetical protein MSG28_002844 [Choristoneura fumiferana]
MRQRMLSLGKAFAGIQRVPVRTFKGEQRCDAHMNELPIPCGPWEPWYKDKQSFYGKILLFGVSWFILAVVTAISTESINLLWGPPCQPGPPSDMEEECTDAD